MHEVSKESAEERCRRAFAGSVQTNKLGYGSGNSVGSCRERSSAYVGLDSTASVSKQVGAEIEGEVFVQAAAGICVTAKGVLGPADVGEGIFCV